MTVTMISARVRPERTEALERSAAAMFAAIEAAQPAGVRYSSYRVSGSATYVILLELQEGAGNPLIEIAAVRDFQDALRAWLVEVPVPEQLSVVGEYRAF
jgi:hypothetical protein